MDSNERLDEILAKPSVTRHMMRGPYITFEGCEGSGKSTQQAFLYERLQQEGYPVLRTREPGGTALGERIRDLLLDPRIPIFEKTESLLFWSTRYQHHKELVQPAQGRGIIVLGDRDADSSIVYQGFARGIPLWWMIAAQLLTDAFFRPDKTLLYTGPIEELIARARGRNTASQSKETRFDDEELQFHKKVDHGYHWLAHMHPFRIKIIDAMPRPEAIHEETYAAAMRVIKKYELPATEIPTAQS